jgi:hypothetical protein
MEKESTSVPSIDIDELDDMAVKTKRKQSDISSFFGGSSKKKPTKAAPSNSSTSRTLQMSTATKWKTTSLAKYNASEWLLIIESNATKGVVESLKCETCTTFRDRIMGMKGFSTQWSEHGSTRLQHASALLHATSEPHKKSFDLFLKQKGLSLTDRNESLQDFLRDNQQADILTGVASMQKIDIELTKKKFETAYYVAKEELSLLKYTSLLKLEERHGVTLGNAYRNENTGGVFIDYISQSLATN